MKEISKQKLSRPMDPSPRGSSRPEEGSPSPSPQHSALFSLHLRQDVWCLPGNMPATPWAQPLFQNKE